MGRGSSARDAIWDGDEARLRGEQSCLGIPRMLVMAQVAEEGRTTRAAGALNGNSLAVLRHPMYRRKVGRGVRPDFSNSDASKRDRHKGILFKLAFRVPFGEPFSCTLGGTKIN